MLENKKNGTYLFILICFILSFIQVDLFFSILFNISFEIKNIETK